jgi:hypothetical protein
MSGDYSRDTFDALRDYAGVFLQQGRAALDADWNEMVAIFERRMRAATVDTIGRAVVPLETPLGFQIQLAAGPSVSIGRGRKYLHGLLLECHGAFDATTAMFDRGRDGANGPEGVLDELISPPGGDFVPYTSQPYWPTPEPLPQGNGPHLAYLVAWQREVTALENLGLLEPALGGLDTATRWQTVWQVRFLPNVGPNATCATPDDQLAGWEAEIAPSTARLTTRTIEIEDPEDPCLVPPTDGFTGIENQLYRVELHTVGAAQTDARFKFSRENASVAASIESFGNPADRITVQRIGRDEVLRFRAGDWVEVTDDHREFNHQSGQMLRVAVVNEETREIELEGAIAADLVPSGIGTDTPATRRSRLIRWDQRGIIRDTNGNQWVDLDAPASDGLIPVPPTGTVLVLESGITVEFSTAAQPAGGFRAMDYWRFAARTAGTQIEELTNAPPDGVQRHYSRLAIVSFPNSVQDCRVFWPPSFGGEAECCGCTVCVTPETHNSGALTIQAAIDQIGGEGGTVCLSGGTYVLQAPVTIDGGVAVTVEGQGALTLLVYQGTGPAIRVRRSADIQLQRFSVVARLQGSDVAGVPATPVAGIALENTALAALRRIAVLVVASGDVRRDPAIALDGVAIGAKIEECLALAPVALGSLGGSDAFGGQQSPDFLALAELRVLDNILFGSEAGVQFGGLAINVADAIFDRNLVLGGTAGMDVNWFEANLGATAIGNNAVTSNGAGLRLGVNHLRLQDNQISGGGDTGDGVDLVPNFIPAVEIDAQVIGNSIGDLAGSGIRLQGQFGALLIKRNIIRRCREAAIAATGKQVIRYTAIDNNVIEDIADSADQQGAGAIVLSRVEEGLVSGNRIRGVGQGDDRSQTYVGIALYGVGIVSVESNTISEIGPGNAASPATGIWARLPYFELSARGNRVSGALTNPQDDRSLAWIGLLIGDVTAQPNFPAAGGFSAASVPGLTPDQIVFATVGNQWFAVTNESLRAAGPVRERQILINANQIYHAGETNQPLVSAMDTGDATTTFTDNQVRLEAIGTVPAIVSITAPRVIAGNNAVRRNSDQDAMHINVGEGGAATVIGNITFGNIRVFPNGLNPPFDALNLLAS